MNSLTWSIAILALLFVLALGASGWLLVRLLLRQTRALEVTLTSVMSSTAATLTQSQETALSSILELQAKTMGSLIATQKEALSGARSSSETTARLLSEAVTLLATKDPIAYAQIQSNAAAHRDEDGATPYPAAGDAEWAAVNDQQQTEIADEAAQKRAALARFGVNPDDITFA